MPKQKPELDAREDWYQRLVATRQPVSTTTVNAIRRRIDPDETLEQTRNVLQKLERAKLVTSEKDGRETTWTAK